MKNRESRAALLFLSPAIVILSVFFFAPVIAGFALSVTDFDLYTLGDVHNLRFVALHNYRELLANPVFWSAFGNTLYFALVGGPLTVAVSLFAALLVNSKLTRWKAAFRTIYFAPVVTTLVAVALVFKYLYHPRFGILNIHRLFSSTSSARTSSCASAAFGAIVPRAAASPRSYIALAICSHSGTFGSGATRSN